MNALSIAPDPVARRLLNVGEFLRMAETGILHEDERVELVDGEILRMSPIGGDHIWAVTLPSKLLWGALGVTRPLQIQSQLHLGQSGYLQPDLMILRDWPDPRMRDVPCPGDVLFLCEASDSSLHYDLGRKLSIYAHHQIPEVWVADLNGLTLHVFRNPGPDGYDPPVILKPGETIAPLCLPECSIDPAGFMDVAGE